MCAGPPVVSIIFGSRCAGIALTKAVEYQIADFASAITPTRPVPEPTTWALRTGSFTCADIRGVSIHPGQMAFTVTPRDAASSATARVSPSTPCFDAT